MRPDHETARLVGRSGELATLVGLVRKRRGGTAAVSGEPGIGKTSLLRDFARTARGDGWLVANGRATEFERDLPFGMFAGAIDDLLPAVAPEVLAPLGRERLLATLFAGLPAPAAGAAADSRPEPAAAVDVERYRLYRAVRALLEALAQRSGLVLILDDLHWADGASLELCEYLLRYPPAGRFVLVLAFRPRQLPVRLPAALERDLVEVVNLGPLTIEDVSILLPGHSPAARMQLHAASNGNPLYLQALARAGAGGGERPESVQAALVADLAVLTAEQSVVLHAAAVVGDVVEVEVVASVAQMAVTTTSAMVDALVRRDLVRPVAGAGRFAFRHPLVREAAYEAAGAGWRIAAHERAMTVLAERGASAAVCAHHAERAGDSQAVDLLVAAAHENLHGAPAAAAHWLQAALCLVPDEPESVIQRLTLLGMLGRALGVTGQLREARDVVHEVLRLLPASEAALRAQTTGLAAALERLLGNHVEARAMLLAELAAVAEPNSAPAAILQLGMASARLMGGGFDDDRDWAGEAVSTARSIGDTSLLAAALGLWVASSGLTGDDPGKQAAYLTEAANLVDALPDGELVRHLEAAVWVGWGEVVTERPGDALRHLDRALRLTRETGQSHLVTYLMVGLGMAHALQGRLVSAWQCFTDALDAAILTGSDELRTMALSCLCWVTAWQGDLDAAARFGAEAITSAEPGMAWLGALANGMYARVSFCRGDVDGAVERLVSAAGGPGLDRMQPMSRVHWYEFLANAEATRNRPAEALEWANRGKDLAAMFGLPMHSAFADLAQGHAMLPADPGLAAARAVTAASAFDDGGDLVDAGRAHLLAAVAYAAAGDMNGARDRFSLARLRFADSGARWFLGQVAGEERRMNARQPRRRPARAGAGEQLTPREREITDLLVIGLTNREIADRLFVGVRTVETHVSRLLRRFGVKNRAALAHRLSSP
jgi:DNA-binding NarL/FixJ family response regulator